jgi:hypothetical protein
MTALETVGQCIGAIQKLQERRLRPDYGPGRRESLKDGLKDHEVVKEIGLETQ